MGRTIYDEVGRPMVMKGTRLTEGLIQSMLNHRIELLYVEDDRLRDMDIVDSIPVEMRVDSTVKIKKAFESIAKDPGKIDKVISDSVPEFKQIVSGLFDQLSSDDRALNLLSSVKSFDDHVYTHSFNVMVYSVMMAMNLGYTKKEIDEIGLGALLHDVGKILIPTDILHKKGRLTDDEFGIVKDHAEIGFNLLRKQYDVPLLSAHCAFQHHERMDGTGYPRRLFGDKIHKYARVMGVADVFDAVTSDRVYRKAMMPHEGLELIYAGYGTQFDKDIVDVFRKSIVIYPEGMSVKLTDGRSGVVFRYNKDVPAKPIVRVLYDEGGDQVIPYDVDMAKDLTLFITDCDLLL